MLKVQKERNSLTAWENIVVAGQTYLTSVTVRADKEYGALRSIKTYAKTFEMKYHVPFMEAY